MRRWAWMAGVLGAVVVLVIASPRAGRHRMRSDVTVVTAADRREVDAAQRAWQSAHEATRLAQFGVAADAQIALRRRDTLAPNALVIDGARTSADSLATASVYRRALDRAWERLELGRSKVGVGVVVLLQSSRMAAQGPDGRATPVEFWPLKTVVVPDAADPGQCLVVLSNRYAPGGADRRTAPAVAALAEWLSAELGACAFAARYGVPGRSARIWLESRGYDVAATSNWLAAVPAVQPSHVVELPYEVLYLFPSDVVACAAGRPSGCRDALRVTTDQLGGDERMAPIRQRSRLTDIGPVGADHLLADIARATGPTRFAAFWTSELAVDSALTVALGQPVGSWMATWQRGEVRSPSLGPVASAASWAGSVVLVVLCLVLAVGQSRWRQVR